METSHEDGSGLRVASFSCYLDAAKESLVRRVSAQDTNNMSIRFSNKDINQDNQLRLNSDHNLLFQVPAAPIQDPTSAFSFSFSPHSKRPAEIGVFGADHYFNTKLDYHVKTKTLLAPATTPSLCSDTTSTWNSQTTLLPDLRPIDQPHQMKQKRAMATRLFMGFACRGPCFDKKSVITRPPPPKNHDPDESRRSIEVFGSRKGSSRGGDVATNMERKLSMLTWDAIPIPKGRNQNHPPTSTTGSATICDAASDASSDLFEIEDVSGTIYPLLEAPDDGASTCMSPATSLYAPSEASIQWSVVTASAADFSTDFNDDSVSAKVVKTRTANHVHKSRPSGLLGCKSIKAVEVAAQNVCVIKPTKDLKP